MSLKPNAAFQQSEYMKRENAMFEQLFIKLRFRFGITAEEMRIMKANDMLVNGNTMYEHIRRVIEIAKTTPELKFLSSNHVLVVAEKHEDGSLQMHMDSMTTQEVTQRLSEKHDPLTERRLESKDKNLQNTSWITVCYYRIAGFPCLRIIGAHPKDQSGGAVSKKKKSKKQKKAKKAASMSDAKSTDSGSVASKSDTSKSNGGKSDVGKSDVGKSDVGKSDVGKSDVGKSDASKSAGTATAATVAAVASTTSVVAAATAAATAISHSVSDVTITPEPAAK